MPNGYPSDWNTRRRQVYKRDGYTCQNCGTQGGPKGNTELNAHHIVPKSKGGTHSKNNLVTICRPCHDAVHYDQQAPTHPQHYSNTAQKIIQNGDKELIITLLNDFGDICTESADFVEEVSGDLIILSDGTLEDKTLENKRVHLIQELGSIDIHIQSLTGEYEIIEDIERYMNTLMSLFMTFETVGKIIEDDSLSTSKKREIVETKISDRINKIDEDSDRTKKALDEFNREINNAQQNTTISSSIISRLFNF